MALIFKMDHISCTKFEVKSMVLSPEEVVRDIQTYIFSTFFEKGSGEEGGEIHGHESLVFLPERFSAL